MRYHMATIPMVFGSTHFADFRFFYLLFFRLTCYLYRLVLVRIRATVRVRNRFNSVYCLVCFYQGYCTLTLVVCYLLLRHRWRTNKFSNFKIHNRHIYSHCHF